jgi:hypothetical protein
VKIFIVTHDGIPVAIATTPKKAMEFAGLHDGIACVDILEGELDRPPEFKILAGHLVYHKDTVTGTEIWPDKDFAELF